mmetsp:Transcript_11367/g.28747  ORF Transcript_11367/g.28747 Transcript_11367/m.28747 type:complete len:380 (-) Transcript_11367:357-1496(-)|eukprot:CAMPEP_0116093850 /NCGR_PEP_ID=MMETSP0327-20121206/8817_1 /TAXON_ID=44447 /ORGANISM="Pseudo-nitzschia delicatissima, Strain B596" /LENGTH=379 /DNA_ID=CAMNT_0003585413 /DNA_START=523 /DNA_END=1662 /DNA_ORIENTATION=+
MEVSKSDIDFEFDSSDTEGGDDVSIATDASSVARSPLSKRGVLGVTKQLDSGLNLEDEGDDFLSGIGGDDSDNSDLSIGSEELMSPSTRNGDDKRVRMGSEEFGPPMVVPLKTGSDHSCGNMNEPIEPGSRGTPGSQRSSRPGGDFARRVPVRTKSGEGLTASTHSAASGRRKPPPRTKSGEGIVKKDDVGSVSNHRRRPPPRTKSGNADGIRRRPPGRTKSGGTLRGGKKADNNVEDPQEEEEESIYYEGQLADDDSFDESAVPTSPTRRHKSYGNEEEYRELALKRNSARRQRSSDFLGAMRDATRNLPSRSQSSAGITNGRRGPNRSKSSGVMPLKDGGSDEFSSPGTPGRKPLRRKAPSRTKSGGRLTSALPLET